MKIKELIEKLKQYPEDTEVVLDLGPTKLEYICDVLKQDFELGKVLIRGFFYQSRMEKFSEACDGCRNSIYLEGSGWRLGKAISSYLKYKGKRLLS